MSGWAGYMLGQMAAESEQSRNLFVAKTQHRMAQNGYEVRIQNLVAKGQEFLDHIKWQEGIMKERKDQIAALEADLVQVRSDLERQQSLTNQWKDFGDKSEANYDELKAWADKAEASLKQYRALYGPLPDAPKSSS
ncbi:hypothetical protein [Gluconobacter oxydans]|uniref:Uncharacterized protein n=1 Tax=Gluconobacter oxydans NBRC 3293 TaxID=1315969 RepID=A0A829WTE1_GLUOY|nr:hypothetical protein [Gluconobacter oxydans]GEM18475.1 hypothetical protein NBRC3293_2972 [Gluconobacter oxydans NBRC 3293]GEM18583.1 hypothetical protein NBRC3293_3080 [Gluconobacter oxydans NBRC 3293]